MARWSAIRPQNADSSSTSQNHSDGSGSNDQETSDEILQLVAALSDGGVSDNIDRTSDILEQSNASLEDLSSEGIPFSDFLFFFVNFSIMPIL